MSRLSPSGSRYEILEDQAAQAPAESQDPSSNRHVKGSALQNLDPGEAKNTTQPVGKATSSRPWSSRNRSRRSEGGSILKHWGSRRSSSYVSTEGEYSRPGKLTLKKHAHFDNPKEPGTRYSKDDTEDPKESTSQDLHLTGPVKKHLERHREGRFDWILTIPLNSHLDARGYRKAYLGCTVLRQRSRPEEWPFTRFQANSYTVIATPLAANPSDVSSEECAADQTQTSEESLEVADIMETTEPKRDQQASPRICINGRFSSPAGPRSPDSSFTRVEDTFEELDRLEEQFEAVGRIMHIERVPSPDNMPIRSSDTAGGEPSRKALKRASSTTTRPLGQASTMRVKSSEPTRARSLRKATSMTFNPPAAEKSSSPQVASLLPPKPLAKSSKAPTVSTYELPGEAVARRLKQQREARLSKARASEPPPASRVRTGKAPTQPNFELPGEAISRRKREEREAKLRAQEDEERKRRAFKARPIGASTAQGANYPRETVASRARRGKAAVAEYAEATLSTAAKRQSVIAPSRSARASSANASPSRGQGSASEAATEVALVNKGTSSTARSISSKRSNVSSNNSQVKLSGKEIYERDNSRYIDRTHEKRDREAAAKAAREEAAERSRMLSREWREKQKRRLSKFVPAVGKESPSRNVSVR